MLELERQQSKKGKTMAKFRNAPDALSYDGALALKQCLEIFWARRGHKPDIRLVPLRTKTEILYCIRSGIGNLLSAKQEN